MRISEKIRTFVQNVNVKHMEKEEVRDKVQAVPTDREHLQAVLSRVHDNIVDFITEYLRDNPHIRHLVLGVSGGLDSAMCALLCKAACDAHPDLNVKVVGVWIGLCSNTKEEKARALAVGYRFCHDFIICDDVRAAQAYTALQRYAEGLQPTFIEPNDLGHKTRRGNIMARMRMIGLYHLAHLLEGVVVDTDNKSEHELGFYTLHGDVGDVTPLFGLYKTEVRELAMYLTRNVLDGVDRRTLMDIAMAQPTDGLGITGTDVEQIGVASYDEIDAVLEGIGGVEEEKRQRIVTRVDNNVFKDKLPVRLYRLDALKSI